MPKSMTGYGKYIHTDENYKISVEIKSVNSRYLEINSKIPRTLGYFEDTIRNILSQKIKRGRVDLFVQIDSFNSNFSYVIDEKKLLSYKNNFDNIAKSTNIENDMKMSSYIGLPDVLVKNDEISKDIEQLLIDTLSTAITGLCDMRETEGKKIVEDLKNRVSILKHLIAKLEQHTDGMVDDIFEKLRKKIDDLTQKLDIQVDDSKIIEQAAIYADKMNVTEEIVRFTSHIKQLENFLQEDTEVGKKTDFLLQEMNREINTIGSKSQKSEIVSLVVQLKSELEKIREQIQNIE
jgi:TIGR00255 family protein